MDWQPGATAEEAWSAYVQLRKDVVALRQSFAEIAETAYSPDGLVRVTVGGHCELTELVLDPRIYRNPDSAALAESITCTLRAAVTAVTARMAELTRAVLPDGGPLLADDVDLRLDRVLQQVRVPPGERRR